MINFWKKYYYFLSINIDSDRFNGIIIEEATNDLSVLEVIKFKYLEKFAN